MRFSKLLIVLACSLIISSYAVVAEPNRQASAVTVASQSWGELVTWDGVSTTYDIYKQNFVYGSSDLLITDIRPEDRYSDKESYEIRSLTVYRAHDGQNWRENQPVVFFVHGGAWIDGYEDWYDFVSQSFTGEKGWVTVVIDYCLTSDQVFLADEYCPDRATCNEPTSVVYRTKAAWYPDNIGDVASAFQWVVENISDNGGDAEQIVVFGHSAGGHLVSLLATHADYDTLRSSIKGVISMSGAYSLKELSMPIFGDAIDQTWQGGHVDNNSELDEASPTTYIVPGMSLPSFYLLYCQLDLPSLYEQAIAFRIKLESLGLPVHHDCLLTYSHVTEMEAIADITEEPMSLIVNFIETVLRHEVYLPLVVR
jgi:acetyl esterase/lipase